MGLAPHIVELPGSFEERFGEAAAAQQPVEYLLGIAPLFGCGCLADVEGVYPVLEVAAGEGVARLSIEVEFCASRDYQSWLDPLGVEDALEPALPVGHLMEFVENDELLGSIPRLFGVYPAVLLAVVVEVDRRGR